MLADFITQNWQLILTFMSVLLVWILFRLIFKWFIDGITIPWINDYKYWIKKYFFSYNEVEFYTSLKKVLNDNYWLKYEVYPKVRLSDILGPEKWDNWYKRLSTRHIDFVIVDKDQIFKPMLAIELSKEFHKQYGKYQSDSFKNRVLKKSKLPVIRFNDSSSTNEETIGMNLIRYLWDPIK